MNLRWIIIQGSRQVAKIEDGWSVPTGLVRTQRIAGKVSADTYEELVLAAGKAAERELEMAGAFQPDPLPLATTVVRTDGECQPALCVGTIAGMAVVACDLIREDLIATECRA